MIDYVFNHLILNVELCFLRIVSATISIHGTYIHLYDCSSCITSFASLTYVLGFIDFSVWHDFSVLMITDIPLSAEAALNISL